MGNIYTLLTKETHLKILLTISMAFKNRHDEREGGREIERERVSFSEHDLLPLSPSLTGSQVCQGSRDAQKMSSQSLISRYRCYLYGRESVCPEIGRSIISNCSVGV